MALNKDVLGLALFTVTKAFRDAHSPTAAYTDSELTEMWKDIAEQIILHFETAGVVNTTVATPDTLTGTGVGTIT